jgi:hypothetical protein
MASTIGAICILPQGIRAKKVTLFLSRLADHVRSNRNHEGNQHVVGGQALSAQCCDTWDPPDTKLASLHTGRPMCKV